MISSESNAEQIVHIDGSRGEGGGQIVRSALALSLVTGTPVEIANIRAGRQKPGLMRQHLTAVKAAAQIGSAEVTGAEIGSTQLTFSPQQIRHGDYLFSIGSAGSTTLVLQTILPALIIADGASTVTLEGGTHNQWAPPFDFLEKAFLPLVNRMGPKVSVELERHGFFPAGGGRLTVKIEPVRELNGFDLLEKGDLKSRSAVALISNLPREIAERETDVVLRRMGWDAGCATIHEIASHGPGNLIYSKLEYEHVTEVFTGFGRVGARAEHVAREVVQEARHYLKSCAPVGEYLADQIMLPLGISAWQSGQHHRGGSYRTMPLTRHSTTHIELLQQMLGIDITVSSDAERHQATVTLRPPTGTD